MLGQQAPLVAEFSLMIKPAGGLGCPPADCDAYPCCRKRCIKVRLASQLFKALLLFSLLSVILLKGGVLCTSIAVLLRHSLSSALHVRRLMTLDSKRSQSVQHAYDVQCDRMHCLT